MGAITTLKNWFMPARGFKNEEPAKTKRGNRIYHRIKKARQYRVDLEMDELGKAVDSAKDIERPDYENLYSIYEQVKKDRHLKSQVEVAINDIQQSPFVINIDGNENDELKELFDAEWFDDFIEYAAEAEFWGHSLIEFPGVNDEKVWKENYLIPRENVNPEKQQIILDRDSTILLPYGDKLEQLNLVEIFGKETLGLFEYAAEEVILKKYARTDWSQASEKYGMPLLDVETETEDKKELDAMEDAAANFAANGYFIHGADTKVNIQQPQKGDFYKIYQEAIMLANSEISKLINGQTGTSDNQAWSGTAETHERVKNAFTRARLRRIQNHVNGKLIPLMIKNGYQGADQLAKASFVYRDLMEEEPQLATEPGEDPADPDAPGEDSSQSQSQSQAQSQLTVAVGSEEKRRQSQSQKKKPVAATDPLDGWLKRFFDDLKNNPGQTVDAEVWKMNFESLRKAMGAAGIQFTDTYQYAELATELQRNAAAFAAFKNHAEQKELFKLLVDDKGEPRSFAAFKKAAKPLTEKYNKEWLLTEYKQAEASSQMAVKWEGFKEEADLYPNLRYDAVVDGETRDTHRELNGTIRPIDDPFWNSHYPPNGWGCRCTVTQTDEKVTPLPTGLEPDEGFEYNTGKDRKLFSDDAGYTGDLTNTDKSELDKQAGDFLKKYMDNELVR